MKAATYTPTQRIGYLAADALTGMGMQPYTANDLTSRIGNVLGLTPLGVAGSALDFVDAKRRDDFPRAVTAAIGMILGATGGAAFRRAAETAAIGDSVPIAGRTLYHYTDEAGLNGILEEERLNPSLKATSPNDVRYGNGQYLSDISPGNLKPAQLSRAFLKIPFQGKRLTQYLEINTGDLDVIRGRPGVYVIPNEVPLDLSGRVIGSGKVPSE
ncbi:HYD1 signature containing ADP-ribosyltransferase family protein [Bradyrhizobium sp. BR 1433]|uniref:HYD1 signature containing ADP-ribosyltransferase family protein n=1 Tax=Bradyrhizobium sp. BR 1433 TaxID=3447967 RepID=UPI003EE5A57A